MCCSMSTSNCSTVSGWNGWVTTTNSEPSLGWGDFALCALRRDRQRPLLGRAGLGNQDSTRRQRVEPSSGIGLGRPVQRMMQGTDRVETLRLLDASRGGTSHDGHSPALLASLRTDKAAALPITGGYVVQPARPVLRPPPTPCRPAAHFPVSRL